MAFMESLTRTFSGKIVFNIRGNNYRLVTRVVYVSQKVFVLKVMTHDEYDQDKWKEECGCFAPPPTPTIRRMIKTRTERLKRKRR
jgi:hypothetical protein